MNLGDEVRPGQVIGIIDSHNEETGLQAARARLAGALAQQAEAHGTYARIRGLVGTKAVSVSEFEQAEALSKIADTLVDTARSDITLAENRLSYTRLVSDVAGSVTAVGAEPGEVIRAGVMVAEVAERGGRDAVLDFPPR